MCRADRRAPTLRRPCVESLETRLALSGHAILEANIPVTALESSLASRSDVFDVQADLTYAHEQLGLTGFGQTVAVIDSGVAYDHPALGAGLGSDHRVVGGWDFTEENDADPFDDPPGGFHGTHVAGIIGSGDLEHLGLAPDVHLVALRVFNDLGASDFAWVEHALQWVHDNRDAFEYPITTVNLSLGAGLDGEDIFGGRILEDELARLHRDGIFVAVASGNDFRLSSPNELDYPAASRHVVPVASHAVDDLISDFSQRSPRVLVAPGEQVTSTAPDFIDDFNGITDDFLTISGTSSAAPFVAGASVLVRQALQLSGKQQVDQDMIQQIMRRTARRVYDPVTRTSYPHIDLQAALDAALQSPVRDLGTVASRTVTGLFAELDGSLYRVAAARDGVFTIQVPEAMAQGQVTLEVYDAQRQWLADGRSVGSQQRVDLQATAGQVFFFRLSGEHLPVSVQLNNLVSWKGNQLELFGTKGGDVFRLAVGPELGLSVNGVEYEFGRQRPVTVRIRGGKGEDTLRLTASPGNETAVLDAGSLRMEGSGFVIEGWDLERQYVFGGGGQDEVQLNDSPGRDFFRGLPTHSLMQGSGFKNFVRNFAVVRASAHRGEGDRARLFGSAGDDTFHGFSRDSLLTGAGFYIHVHGFSSVRGTAGQGGRDTAYLGGSRSDAVVLGNPKNSRVLIRKDSIRLASGFADVRFIDSQRSRAAAARLGIEQLDADHVDQLLLRAL